MSAKQANVTVEARSGEPIEKTLRRFRRACERAGVKKAARNKRRYEKPSDVRRRQARRTERNRRRAERKNQQREKRRWSRVRQKQRALGEAFDAVHGFSPASPRQSSDAQARRAG